MKFKFIVMLSLFCYGKQMFAQQNSENGYSINPNSTNKLLIIWAEANPATFDQPSSVTGYGTTALPSDAHEYFDATYTPGTTPTAYLTKYFYEMSFGKLYCISRLLKSYGTG